MQRQTPYHNIYIYNYVIFYTGNGQKSRTTSPMTAPAVRPALTGKSTPESVTACPIDEEEEEEVQMEDGKDEVPEETALCLAKAGEPGATVVGEPRSCTQDNQLAESEMDSESCKPNEHITHGVSRGGPGLKSDCNEHTSGQVQQTVPAKGEDVGDEEVIRHQVIQLPNATPNSTPDRGVSFRLSDLPEPRERSESFRTDVSSFSSVANFRAGESPSLAG